MTKQQNYKRTYQQPSPEAQADLSKYVFGKVMPNALPLEQAVLGAIILDKNALRTIDGILQTADFYTEAHQHIYSACLRLFESQQPIDLLTVMEATKAAGTLADIGGPAYLAELTHMVASSTNIEYHSRIIQQLAVRRRLIEASSAITQAAYDETQDVFDVTAEAESRIASTTSRIVTGRSYSMPDIAAAWIKRLDELRQKKDNIIGITWGRKLYELDNLTGGLIPPDLIIVAARPGMGKTAFVCSVAMGTAEAGNRVALFSLEMSREQLFNRMVSMESGLPTNVTSRPAKMSEQDYQRTALSTAEVSNLPIVIDDTAGISIQELRSKARHEVRAGAKLIIVDYIQLMSDRDRGNGNREQEVSAISRGLKAIAKELNVPVIALSQLSRAVETRGGTKRPTLSDLRESGSIEQDADIVSFIYRPEYYGILEDENGNSLRGVEQIIVAKHRNGAIDDVLLRFDGTTTRFYNYSDIPGSNQFPTPTPALSGALQAGRPDKDDEIPF